MYLCWVGTPQADSASTATSAPLQVVFALEHKRDCIKEKDSKKRTLSNEITIPKEKMRKKKVLVVSLR